MITLPGYLGHLPGLIVKTEAWDGISILCQNLRSCPTAAATYQNDTLWGSPGAVPPSALVQTVSLLPGATAGEGVAQKPCR